jgi:integrase
MKKRARRTRGTGRVWLPEGSSVYMAKWYESGKPVRRSTGKTTYNEASTWVKQQIAAAMGGKYTPPSGLTVADLAKDYFVALQANGAKDLERTKRRWELHLAPVFAKMKPLQVSTAVVRHYINSRSEAGAENGTANREVAALQRMFSLAHEEAKVKDVPYFPRLKESNVRKGFVEDAAHSKIAEQAGKVGLWMRAIYEVGYELGWRESEVVGLRVCQIDLAHRVIRLDPGSTKNDDGRTIKMTPTLFELLRLCVAGKQPEHAVFTRADGSAVVDFRRTWWSVCIGTGLGSLSCRKCGAVVLKKCEACGATLHKGTLKYAGLLYHDLRRTAIRNMVRRGIPEKVAMMISGHKTRSVFDRYNIVSERDLADAALKIEAGIADIQNGHMMGTDAQEQVQVPKPPTATKGNAVN